MEISFIALVSLCAHLLSDFLLSLVKRVFTVERNVCDFLALLFVVYVEFNLVQISRLAPKFVRSGHCVLKPVEPGTSYASFVSFNPAVYRPHHLCRLGARHF